VADRWATFDCYGTIVDWNGGILAELERLFGVEGSGQLLLRYHEIEPEIQAANPGTSYREVLTLTLERLAVQAELSVPEGETSALARSLPSWPVFPDAPAGLTEAKSRGWRLGILSNTDRDLIDASLKAIGVPFDLVVVAGEIGSYKPATGHWSTFREQTGVASKTHVHVAQSLFHDIAPAAELGIQSIWINRLDEPSDSRPAKTLPDLSGLADALDELVLA
jgi:2-haloacid dehalogenase